MRPTGPRRTSTPRPPRARWVEVFWLHIKGKRRPKATTVQLMERQVLDV